MSIDIIPTSKKETQRNLLKLDKSIQPRNDIIYNILEQHKQNKLYQFPIRIKIPNQPNTVYPYSNYIRQTKTTIIYYTH